MVRKSRSGPVLQQIAVDQGEPGAQGDAARRRLRVADSVCRVDIDDAHLFQPGDAATLVGGGVVLVLLLLPTVVWLATVLLRRRG
ncbi:hypothetical protein ABT294_06400 [Nonomuraea sp. NPDC000554]|uniref:hypothetical protein n=1 Tax=Nonomuraea sp. NPDC000554 TaxID=3154259 RepID=UPI003323643A